MIPISDLWKIEELCNQKYGQQEKIVGIMLARYSLEEVKKDYQRELLSLEFLER